MAFTMAALDLSLAMALTTARLPRLGPANGGPLYLDGWDLGVIGGHKIPGKSRVTGGKLRMKHDKKPKAGADGANPTFHGIDPQEFTLEIEVWTDAQLANLVQVVLADILPKPWSKPATPPPGQTSSPYPAPVPFNHPDLLSLSSVAQMTMVVLGGTPFKRVSTNVLQMTLELLHWLPAPATKTSQASTPLQKVPNKRAAADAAAQNPAPHTQAGFGAPPTVTPGT